MPCLSRFAVLGRAMVILQNWSELELASSAYFIRPCLTLPGRLVLPVDRPCLEFGYGACGVRGLYCSTKYGAVYSVLCGGTEHSLRKTSDGEKERTRREKENQAEAWKLMRAKHQASQTVAQSSRGSGPSSANLDSIVCSCRANQRRTA